MITDTFEGGNVLKFTVGPIKLPPTTGELRKPFKFETFFKGKASESFYTVDSGSSSPFFVMTSGDFQKVKVSTSSNQAFVKSEL